MKLFNLLALVIMGLSLQAVQAAEIQMKNYSELEAAFNGSSMAPSMDQMMGVHSAYCVYKESEHPNGYHTPTGSWIIGFQKQDHVYFSEVIILSEDNPGYYQNDNFLSHWSFSVRNYLRGLVKNDTGFRYPDSIHQEADSIHQPFVLANGMRGHSALRVMADGGLIQQIYHHEGGAQSYCMSTGKVRDQFSVGGL